MNELTEDRLKTLVERFLGFYTFDAAQRSVHVKQFVGAFTITIRASKGDTRRIVGKAGSNINALRQFFRSLGFLNRVTIDLELDEPAVASVETEKHSVAPDAWKPEKFESFIREACNAAFRIPEAIEYKFDASKDGEALRVEIAVSDEEHPKRQLEICSALRTLSAFIGWIHHRRVHLNIIPNVRTAQPATADGRFASAT